MRRATIPLISLVAIIGVVSLGWINRYNIWDEYRLYNYNSPSSVVQLADQTTMTPYARKLFYAYHPAIENSKQFNSDCVVTEQALVLGCMAVNKGIYLYNVTDAELNGVEQVTAAHEMLHVGYSRLSGSELTYVNNLVMSAYNQLAPNNPNLKSEYDSYVKTEGVGSIPNEMHSVIGTEIGNLPPALENYYKRYFTNRQAIVNYANQYQGAFTLRQQAIQQDDQKLTGLQQQITANKQQLSDLQQQLSAEQTNLNQLKATGQIAAYNKGIEPYNQDVNNFNNLLNQTNSLIDTYNQLLVIRNKDALSENKLIQSISSMPSTLSPQ